MKALNKKRRNYLLTLLFRHPPVGSVPTLHGKMAATTAVWMTDQGREAEGAGSVNPAEGLGVGNGRE